MNLNKVQQEVYEDLLLILKQRGRAYLLGWALGTLISLAQHDYTLRRHIRDLSGRPRC